MIEVLLETLTLRPATLDDRESVFKWRNDPDVRRYSFERDPVEWETHVEWFEKITLDSKRHLLIGETEGKPVGVLRIDYIDEECREISIYLVPGSSSQGLGTLLIRQGTEWIRRQDPAVKQLRAKILGENTASLKAFNRAGFEESYRLYEWHAP